METGMGSGRAIVALLCCGLVSTAAARSEESTDGPATLELLAEQAAKLAPHVESDLARAFLAAVDGLPSVDPRTVFYDRDRPAAMTEAQARGKDPAELETYQKRELDEQFYYFTRYGTPLAFVRPLDLVARAGLAGVAGRRVAEFGFGSIGQLRLLAALGADVTGIEVDPLLEALYGDAADTGSIPRAGHAGPGPDGKLKLLFGHFPAGDGMLDGLGGGHDLFISKNTLKRGYIHPEQEVDPRRLVHLGVDDETFVRTVYDLLEPGGFFMIYNLHPAQSADPASYKPWADGRSPFSRELYERVGFEVLAFDREDSEAARAMGARLGWAEQMDLKEDLFGTYTLLRR